jgi:hypothetical protein
MSNRAGYSYRPIYSGVSSGVANPAIMSTHTRQSSTIAVLPWLLIAALIAYLFTRRNGMSTTLGRHEVVTESEKASKDLHRIFVSYSYFEKDAIQVRTQLLVMVCSTRAL